MINKVFNEDCLIGMQRIPDKSIDAIICDLPYGTTACKWDTIIPFEPLWAQYKRVIKDNGVILLFGTEPFSSNLRLSNLKMFKYDWIWYKNTCTGIAQAKYSPMKNHEIISVFYSKKPNFYPIKVRTKSDHIANCAKKGLKRNTTTKTEHNSLGGIYGGDFSEFVNPRTVLEFNSVNNRDKEKLHPTQKPVALLEYLVKTYTNEGDIVLDNCMGSGTTAIACINTNRNYIGFEMDKTYFDIINKRISDMPKPNKITNPSGVTKELWNWELYELKLKFEASSAYISWKGTDLGKNVDLFLKNMGYKIEVEASL